MGPDHHRLVGQGAGPGHHADDVLRLPLRAGDGHPGGGRPPGAGDGRLRDTLEEMGEWDNTIFIFTSDNGGSREGEVNGTSQYFRSLVATARGGFGKEDPEIEIDYSRLDLIGGRP